MRLAHYHMIMITNTGVSEALHKPLATGTPRGAGELSGRCLAPCAIGIQAPSFQDVRAGVAYPPREPSPPIAGENQTISSLDRVRASSRGARGVPVVWVPRHCLGVPLPFSCSTSSERRQGCDGRASIPGACLVAIKKQEASKAREMPTFLGHEPHPRSAPRTLSRLQLVCSPSAP